MRRTERNVFLRVMQLPQAGWGRRRSVIGALAAWALFGLLVPNTAAQTAEVSEAVVLYRVPPANEDVLRLDQSQVRYQLFKHLPMALVRGSLDQIRSAAAGPNVRVVRGNTPLELYLGESVPATGANRVWSELGVTGRNVNVAVVDTGINTRHVDLRADGKVVQNVDVGPSAGEGAEQGNLMVVSERLADSDETGHGTHVASALAGTGVGADGRYVGVAKNASLIGIGGESPMVFWALNAFDWILDQRERLSIKVVNNSWGAGGAYDSEAPVNVATRMLHDAGVTVIFAAGNGGPARNTLNSYSVAPWVIGVAAGRNDRTLAEFSSRGLRADPLYHPTLTAPGVQITAARDPSSFIGSVLGESANEPYMSMSGTSLAAPHVAGVVALMLEANDRLTPDDVKAILVASADAMPDHEEFEVGAGFVNALEAVKRARRV